MKEYLEKHNLRDIEDIAKHIEELKRNTVPNLELISSLCSYIFDGEKTENKVAREQVLQEIKQGYSTRHKSRNGESHKDNTFSNNDLHEIGGAHGKPVEFNEGIKESQSVEKAPVFTYCKVNKNALEALSLRALYGHKKYNKNGADEDWQNFTRVPNGNEEYGNAEFRHALGIGGEEDKEQHLIASAWNAVARLEIYLRDKLNKS